MASYIGSAPPDRDPTVGINAVDGTHIDVSGNAQGDLMYYNGTDWALLTAASSSSGEAVLSGGVGANPSWGSAGDFKNGGDAGGAVRTLGNTDAFALGLETNNINRLNIASDGFANHTLGMVGNAANIATDVTTAANTNASSAGPMTIDTGVTVELGTNSTWTIV
jgi:hypothetical protein